MPGSGGRRSDSDGGEDLPLLGAVGIPAGSRGGSNNSSNGVLDALQKLAGQNGETSNTTGDLEESFMGTQSLVVSVL
jgi:hypothetical protein